MKEYSGAFLQLYREEAFYLERTVHYIHQVGLEYVKGKVVADEANRKALYERLLFSLDGLLIRGRPGFMAHRSTNSKFW